jgi:hypothetical protein
MTDSIAAQVAALPKKPTPELKQIESCSTGSRPGSAAIT